MAMGDKQKIAIVGSGPAGFYCAEALAKSELAPEIDILDRLFTPYGLVRNGVAPDHQGTKNVWRVFERTAKRPNVRFFGNVEVGKDITVEVLSQLYDAVVFAHGAPRDRTLGVAGEHLSGIVPSQTFSQWYNGHPDAEGFVPPYKHASIAVIGNGNVAIDVSRILCRTEEEMLATDLPQHGLEALRNSNVKSVHMLGRRGPLEASFTPVELKELGELKDTDVIVNAEDIPDHVGSDVASGDQRTKEKILEALKHFLVVGDTGKKRKLYIHFYAAPVRLLGETTLNGIEIERTRVEQGKAVLTGERRVIEVSAVVPCIGYQVLPFEGLEIAEGGAKYKNNRGHVRDNLWVTGWAKRGPSGVIGTNRNDSIEVANLVLEALKSSPQKNHSKDLSDVLQENKVAYVSFDGWEKIAAHEHSEASPPAPRKKVTTWKKFQEFL